VDGRERGDLILRLVSDALRAWGLPPERVTPLCDWRRCSQPASVLVDAAAVVTGNDELGLELAQATAVRALTPVFYIMMSAPTLGAALYEMTRFAPVALHRPTTAALTVDKDSTTFLFGPEYGGRIYSEYVAALLMRIFRYLIDDPQLKPIAARFTHSPPADLGPRYEVFGTELLYDQPRNALVLSAEQAGRPCAHASSILHSLHERALQDALHAELEEALLHRVRSELENGLAHGAPTMTSVARSLGMSERTLQRRLHERATSFERLLQEVRREKTLQLLSEHSISLEAVARATGYCDASSFHRAFRAWTGITPAVYRARLKASAAGKASTP
jgi:AraC-like DNA-binding protein